MNCSRCRHDNPPEAKFCLECGARMARSCQGCGTNLPPEAKFCLECGRAVTSGAPAAEQPAGAEPPSERLSDPRAYTPKHLAEKILTSRSAVEGERKQVTVLFADLAGYTALSEGLDPEELHALMDRCFQLILREVHRYEGTVNQFTGDGVMALFGAPIALEHAPRRAVLAALDIQKALAPLREEIREQHGQEFEMRIGINTGPVVVGKIGDDLRMDYTAVGDTTNLAARLQQNAKPGRVLISDATRRLVKGYFDLEPLPLLTVKGKSEPVSAFEVLGERAVSGRIEAIAETGLTPLVGRKREFDTLMDAFETARGGHGQMVFVVGDAGMGKSRLLYEFRQHLAAEPHAWFEGRCASYGTSTAFHTIIDGLRRFFRIEDQDDDARASAKLAEVVLDYGKDLDWTLPLLRHLLSLPAGDPQVLAMDAVTRRSETFQALCALFKRISEREPLVFVAEDLHWIDTASEDFLGYLGDSVPTGRVMLLFTHRPGYRHPFGDRSYHVRVPLRVLSEDEMARMAGSLLEAHDLPEALRHLIARKAEGNPFFIEEVTKSLIEQGVLKLEKDRLVLTRDVSEINIPDSIQDVLMARIDRLAEEPKRAIQIASIIGREFALRLLERISEVGDRLEGVIRDLRTLELIYEKAAHPELAFMFKHALTHDVAYQSVLVQRRKVLHAVVGSAIEELYRDRLQEHYDALAHHFERAEDWERALRYHTLAAEKAAEAFANHAAADHFRRAIDIAGRLGEAVPREQQRLLQEGYAVVCFYTSRFKEAGEASMRAADLADQPEDEARNLTEAAQHNFWGHEYDKGAANIERAFDIVRKTNMPAVEAYAFGTKGFMTVVQTGDLETYRSLLMRAQERAQVANDEAVTAMVDYSLGEYAEWTGDYRKAITHCEAALAAGRRLRLPHIIIWPAWFIGKAYTCLGDYGRAFHHLKDALALTERIGDRAWRTRLLNTTGWCMAEIGDIPAARAFNEQAAKLAHEIGDDEITANAEINLAMNHLAQGDLDEAGGYLHPLYEGLDRREPFQRWRYGMHVQDALGRLALARGEPDRALSFTATEIKAAMRHRAPKIEARALELQGRALATIDRREEAAASLGSALEIARKIHYPPVQWRATSLLAELAKRRGEGAEAARLAHEAKLLVENLARSIPEGDLQRNFGAIGAQLESDPLGAYR